MLHVVLNDPSTSDLMFAKITPEMFKTAIKEVYILAVDIKTTGLDPMEDEIKAITVATRDGEIYILTTEVITSSLIAEVFSGKQLVVHSGSKDISFLMAHGAEIHRVFDTCLADQVIHADVDGCKLSYSLPLVLDRYNVPHTFQFYENGSFWAHGFDVCGCNYLSLYVRHLFELRDQIYAKYPHSSNLFLMVNRLLVISSQMNTTPLKLNRSLLNDYVSDFLEEICSQEAELMDVFTIINDSPGAVRDELFPPDGSDTITPLYDVDDDEAIDSFITRCDYNTEIEQAFNYGKLSAYPNLLDLEKYKEAIHKYNDVLVRLVSQKDDDVFCHYTPISPKSLSIGCIRNFPRPSFAKRNNIPLPLSLTVDPFSIIKDNIFNVDEYEMRAYEIFDVEIFGLAILSSDKNLMRLAIDADEEYKQLKFVLAQKEIEIRNKKLFMNFLKTFFTNGCSMTTNNLQSSSVEKADYGALMKTIVDRYHFAVDTFTGIIDRLRQSGNALIFSEYPISWRNYEWSKTMKAKFTDEFWRDYDVHQQAKDDVWETVNRYYQEEGALQKVVRGRVVDYARLYIMSNVMFTFFDEIRQSDYTSVIRFTCCDKTSFVLSYPAVMTTIVDEIESEATINLSRRFGTNLPLISMII